MAGVTPWLGPPPAVNDPKGACRAEGRLCEDRVSALSSKARARARAERQRPAVSHFSNLKGRWA